MMSFARKDWGVYLELAGLFCMLALWPVLSFSSALMQVALWLGFLFWLISLILKKEKPVLPDRIALVLIAVFFAAVLISLTVTDFPKQSSRGVIKVFRQIAILFLVFYFFRNIAAQSKLKFVVFCSFLLLVVDGAWQYFYGVDFLRGFEAQAASSGRRLSASLEHYGKLAAYLCAVLPVVIGFAAASFRKNAKSYLFWLWSLLSVSGATLLFMTRSRGAFVAFFLTAVIVAVLRRAWKVLAVLCIAGAVVVALLPRSMVIHLDAENKEQSIVERFELWHRAWDVIEQRPWTGTGINTYAVAHQQFDTRQNWRVKNYYAHNGYLQTASEIGIPGTMALVSFFIWWLWINKPSAKDKTAVAEIRWGLLGGSIAFLIFCMGDTAMHSLQPVAAFWFVLGLLGAFNPKGRQEA